MGHESARAAANRAAVLRWAAVAAAVLLVPFAFVVSTLGGLAVLMLGSAVLVMTGIVAGVRCTGHRSRAPGG